MKQIAKSAAKQMLSMLYVHMISLLPGFIVSLLLLPITSKYKVVDAVVSALLALIYFSVIYAKGWRDGNHDRKPQNAENGHILKGFTIALGILLLNFILWLGYWFSWNFLSIDGALATGTAVFYNLLFIFDTIFFSSIGGISGGNINLWGNLLIYLVPLIASGFGYIMGYKGHSLDGKFDSIVYEKKDT